MNTADKPLVSVVIPVYNGEKYLAESIQSVLDQTYGNIEIVCVDDCSKDGSIAILKAFAKEHANLKFHTLPTNGGLSHARNFAIRHAKGEFILPLDADDRIAPEYCQLAMDIFRTDPSVAVVYAKCKRFRGEEFWEWELPKYSKKECYRATVCMLRPSSGKATGSVPEDMTSVCEPWRIMIFGSILRRTTVHST